jgi:hypothetical protein
MDLIPSYDGIMSLEMDVGLSVNQHHPVSNKNKRLMMMMR